MIWYIVVATVAICMAMFGGIIYIPARFAANWQTLDARERELTNIVGRFSLVMLVITVTLAVNTVILF